MITVGLDLSLDHGGIVILDKQGEVVDARFLTIVEKMPGIDDRAFLLPKFDKKGEDTKEYFRMQRFDMIVDAIFSMSAIEEMMLDLGALKIQAALEGYAYAAKSTSILQIAELTGHVKHTCFMKGIKMRIHDPGTVKLFATGSGRALKQDVIMYARKYMDIPDTLLKNVKKKKKGATIIDVDGPGTDLADAYTLAKMLHTEKLLLDGNKDLKDLRAYERKIFLRVTQANPVNILGRPMDV